MFPSTPDLLLDYLATLLAPIFLEAAGNDPTLARGAARQTIAEYRASTGIELLLVAQIIAYSIASIAATVQSIQDDLPPQLALRLQTRASTLGRNADRARKTLEQSMRQPPAAPQHDEEASEPDGNPVPATKPATSATPAVTAPEATSPEIWASNFAEFTQEVANLPGLSPQARHMANIQMAALNEAARSLQDHPPGPGSG